MIISVISVAVNALSPFRSTAERAPKTFSKHLGVEPAAFVQDAGVAVVLALPNHPDVNVHRQQRASRPQAQWRDDRERGDLGHADRQAKDLEPTRALRHVDGAIAVSSKNDACRCSVVSPGRLRAFNVRGNMPVS